MSDENQPLWQGRGYFERLSDEPIQLVGNAPDMHVFGPIASIDYHVGSDTAIARCDVCDSEIEVLASNGVITVPPHHCNFDKRVRRAFED